MHVDLREVCLASLTTVTSALRLLDAVPLVAGAAVMGTGILSIGLHLDHRPVLSDVLLGIAVAMWLGVLAAFIRRALLQRRRWREEAATPGALTLIAGTAVVGDRLVPFGESWAAYALLVVAVAFWVVLVPQVLRRWRTPTIGASFMLTVATESLAGLAAVLALEHRVAWLAWCALAALVVGLAAYVFVLVRADLRQLLVGRGDHWIFGGALAIAALASARSTAALSSAATFAALRPALREITVALWAAAAAWLPVLLAAELRAPRIGYDLSRWSTVFPLGMYAVCSIATSSIGGIGGIGTFGRVWIWIALGIWTLVFIGTIRRTSCRLRAARAA